MTGDQTAYVLRVLTTAYPEVQLSQPGAVMWAKYLAPFNFDDVDEAVDQWIQTNDRFPRINQLQATTRTVMNRKREVESTDRMLGQGPSTPEQRSQVLEMMAVTRKLLADMDKKRHWHGGPNPCEVCGGMKGTLGKLDQRQVEDGVA